MCVRREREGGRGTETVVFAESDQTEADREHAGMYEDGDGVLRRFELRGVGIGSGETGFNVAQHGGRTEGESGHGGDVGCWCWVGYGDSSQQVAVGRVWWR